MLGPLPVNFIDMALGPYPRYCLVDNVPAFIDNCIDDDLAAEKLFLPIVIDEGITQETPFKYKLRSITYYDSTNNTWVERIVIDKPHSQESLTKYITSVKFTLSRDLVMNGLSHHIFDPIVKYTFHNKIYKFQVEDLQVFDSLRYPSNVTNFITDRLHEISNLAGKPVFIPCTVKGEFDLFAAQNKCGKDLFQKYVNTIHKYIDVRNTFLRLIQDYTFTGSQTAEALWISLYGVKRYTGDIYRTKL